MTDDLFPVAELDAPAASRADRRVPMLWIVVGLLLAAGVLAAVLTAGDDRSPQERLQAVPAAAAAEPFAFEMTALSEGGAMAFDLEVSGAFDAATERSRMTMSLEPMGSFELVAEGDVVYVRLPTELAAGRPEGKSWMRVEAEDLGAGGSGLPSSTNPLESFEQLRVVDAPIEDLGSEEVRGVDTTHFRTTLDLSKGADQLPAQAQDALRVLRAVPVDVWLDDQDRPRRQRMVFDLGAMGAGQGTLTLTVESFDFGKAVDVELPDPSEVFDPGASGLGGLFGPAPAPAN